MKALLVIPAAVAVLATGVFVGFQLAEQRPEPDAPATPAETEVVFKNASGETRTLTAAEAAERIEHLEASLAQRRRRADAADEETSAAAPQPAAGDPPDGKLLRPDGKPYSETELVALARESADASLRAAAVRELRHADTDVARAALQAVLADKSTPAAIREEAAKALAQPPNRDKLPEELVTLLRGETDPAVRLALAQGVGRMRDRDAWMTDIVAMVHDEKNPDVRKSLFDAVLRDARDPVAKAELLDVAVNAASSPEERRAALAALPRGKADAETVAKYESLLRDPDAKVRENAVALMGSAQAISPSALAAAFADDDPAVRRAALNSAAGRLPQFANDKSLAKPDYQALVAAAVRLAASDPDPSVRRAAVQQVGNLPKAVRDEVLATGRNDADLFVKLTSYARSPDPVAREGTPIFVSALESSDSGVRDYAYRQLQRLSGVTAPFDARWNAKARADAIGKIRQDLATSGK
jgi:hypothetical protein